MAQDNQSQFKNKIFDGMDTIVSFVIFLVALRLMLYMITSIYATVDDMFTGDFWMEKKDAEILHWIVYFIVMVKAYRVLIDYAKLHRVSLKDITELVIVTSFIEIIFQMQELPVLKIAILGLTGVATLVVYLFYYEKLKDISLTAKMEMLTKETE